MTEPFGTIAGHDDYLYVQCGMCEDIVCPVEEGMTVAYMRAALNEHVSAYHEPLHNPSQGDPS